MALLGPLITELLLFLIIFGNYPNGSQNFGKIGELTPKIVPQNF
jgi:hypothetical protein